MQTCTITLTLTGVADVDALAADLDEVAKALGKHGKVTASPLANRGQRNLKSVAPATTPGASPLERAKRIAQARGLDFESVMKQPGADKDPVGAIQRATIAKRQTDRQTITTEDVAEVPAELVKGGGK